MRRTIPRALLLAATMLTLPVLLPAQAVPNLSGTWILQIDKSDFGPLPAPQSRTDVIEHQEPRLHIKRTGTGASGPISVELTFAVDGKPHKNLIGGNELMSTLKWEGAVLVMESTTQTPQGEASISDRWSLSEDGKTLTQTRNITVQGQSFSQTAVFTRQ